MPSDLFPNVVARIVSGGQTGADRAALDFAAGHGIPWGGWCPKDGWAEDFPHPPGLLAAYPKLTETPSSSPAQRTKWNVRDSDATLILLKGDDIAHSPGTLYTRHCAKALGKPWRCFDVGAPGDIAAARDWLAAELAGGTLNVAGPRESGAPGLYAQSKAFLEALFAAAP